MNYLKDITNIKDMCRICLTQDDNMVSLKNTLDSEVADSPLIFDILENIFSEKIISKENYPGNICRMCYGNIKISYDLKYIYKKSQRILQRYIYLLETTDELEDKSNILELDQGEIFIKDEMFSSDDNDIQDYCIQDPEEDTNSEEENDEETTVVKLQNPNNLEIEIKSPQTVKQDGENFSENPSVRLIRSKNRLTKEYFSSHLCEICNKTFTSAARKELHVQNKHTLDCNICHKTFKNNKAVAYHKRTQHNSNGKIFICPVCKKDFFLKSSLTQHMDVHSRNVSKEICPICGKGFHYRGALFYHMKMHKNERNYICSTCGYRFLNSSGLKKHIRIHTGEKPYTCSFCGRSFLSKNILDNHEKTHTGLKPKMCPYCKKGFITNYNLNIHVSTHKGDIPCKYCKLSFLNTDVLQWHMKFKHNIKYSGVTTRPTL